MLLSRFEYRAARTVRRGARPLRRAARQPLPRRRHRPAAADPRTAAQVAARHRHQAHPGAQRRSASGRTAASPSARRCPSRTSPRHPRGARALPAPVRLLRRGRRLAAAQPRHHGRQRLQRLAGRRHRRRRCWRSRRGRRARPGGRRASIPVAEFFAGPGRPRSTPGELVTEIVLPATARRLARLATCASRGAAAWTWPPSACWSAARRAAAQPRHRVALAAVAPTPAAGARRPRRSSTASGARAARPRGRGGARRGRGPSPTCAARAEYRREMVGVLVARGLQRARLSEESDHAPRPSRSASTASTRRTRSPPTRRCSPSCATRSTSPAPRRAATRASAAPAWCCSTARR